MVIKKLYKFLNKLPKKLNLFYKNKYRSNLIIKNKSKSKKKFDPVTNFDKSFEKYIRSLILKKFPTHSVIGEELRDKKSDNLYKWIIDPIDGTKVFILGGPTWSNLIGLSYNDVPCIGLANFPDLDCFYLNDQTKA